jgi:hypothetical protein
MPFNQPKTAVYYGFQPVASAGGIIQTNPYLVTSSATNGASIFAGDPLVYTTMGTVRALTSAGGVTNFTSSMAFVGVSAQYFPAGTGSTAAVLAVGSTSQQMCLVYDAPDQLYMVHDTTSGVIGSPTGLYKNYALLTTGAVGSTGPSTLTGRSNVALNGVESSVAGIFHVIAMHPIEGGVYSGSSGSALPGTDTRHWIGRFVTGVQVQPSTGVLTIANTSS